MFKLQDAIAEALWAHVKAQRLAAVCEYLGLAPQQPDEDPYNSKRSYVHARLEDKPLPDLMAIARRVVDEYGDDGLRQLLAQMGLHGVAGDLKNLIFAADGPKPQIVLPDSISNTIRIVKNEQYCLVYDQPLEDRGLSWQDLVTWWVRQHPEHSGDPTQARISLRERLRRSLNSNGAELLVFDTYLNLGFDFPALIPQVYLHYDPYTKSELGGASRLARQRMDFLLLMNHQARAVIEIDGVQHYARPADRDAAQQPGAGCLADPARYASMVAEDRELTLQGYEVYRIGGHELCDDTAADMLSARF
ncbi:hypothetical protein AQJ54_42690 [Streptomyces griseorubiginosus]|uniref:AbiJ-NTD3 domain-containing protein n=1 Tax=Streptomyces griseorubiginosus TaxID=67304 RepID=A0A101RM96_9ACTN|nr:hypothetical protein AQJ54_42690 [Streptomyces griseorubiginosus]